MTSPAATLASVLVADNDTLIRDLLHEALGDDGFRVLTARDLGTALRALCTLRFDCVLVDTLESPDARDPWASLREIRAAAGATPVVIFTTQERRQFEGYADRGFAGFVAKPFDIDTLSAFILRVIRRDLPAQSDVAPSAVRRNMATH
jgi:two-component system response regulator QseB